MTSVVGAIGYREMEVQVVVGTHPTSQFLLMQVVNQEPQLVRQWLQVAHTQLHGWVDVDLPGWWLKLELHRYSGLGGFGLAFWQSLKQTDKSSVQTKKHFSCFVAKFAYLSAAFVCYLDDLALRGSHSADVADLWRLFALCWDGLTFNCSRLCSSEPMLFLRSPLLFS